MFIFRSPAGRGTTGTTADHARAGSERLTLRRCQCSDPNAAASDPSRRISSHRTSQGHVVYYRCDCGETRMTLRRWTTEPTTGATRLR